MLPVLLLTVFVAHASGSFRAPRIAGGTEVQPGELPYLGALELYHTGIWYHLCGAALIADNKIVTAAHCLGGAATDYRVVMGEHSLATNEGTEQYLQLQSYVVHPGYNGDDPGYPNDIAVGTLMTDALTNSSFVATVPVANQGQLFTHESCTISGWGSHNGAVTRMDTPSEATFSVITEQACKALWAPYANKVVLPDHVCMHGSGGQAACHYDNGGPMVCNGTLAGVVSWGDGDCDGALPTVLSSVAHNSDWIKQQL